MIIVCLVLVNCDGVEAKGKGEEKWRSCYVIRGTKKVRVKC
jgi:hypothetical protein